MRGMKLDMFKHCRSLRVLGSVMIPVVLGLQILVLFGVWDSYVRMLVAGSVGKCILAALILSSFTALSTMLVWSYMAACFSDPGHVPTGWHPFSSEQEEAAARYGVTQARAQAGHTPAETPPRANFCRKCVQWKPARAHHCSVCGCCILKLDHYCLWIVNAVGLLNQKFFLLFLFYCMLACLEAAAVMIPSAVHLLRSGNLNGPKPGLYLFAAVFTFAFALALVMFLSIHWDMLAKNYTSIESLDKDAVSVWPHDRGLYRNFVEVFGRRRSWWLLPMLSRDDRTWMLSEALEAELQPLVYEPKLSALQMV